MSLDFVIVISDNFNTNPYYFPVVINLSQCPQYVEIAKKFDYCTVSFGLNLPMTRFRFTLISELYLRGSNGRATREVDLSSA